MRALRRRKQTPVLFLTARDKVEDRVKGLELGANDYLIENRPAQGALFSLHFSSRQQEESFPSTRKEAS